MNKDIFSYGRNILDALLDIVISIFQLQNFDKFWL